MITGLSTETASALSEILVGAEAPVRAIAAPGAVIVLTTERLVLIREGRAFRPTTSIRTWPLDPSLRIHLRVRRPSGSSVLIERERGATSFFVADRDWSDALELVAEAQRRSLRA